MKILTKKKWEEINDDIVELQLEVLHYKNEEKTYLEQVDYLNQELESVKLANKDLGNQVELNTEKLNNKNKELNRLKRLLTKNGIEYKKEKKTKEVK